MEPKSGVIIVRNRWAVRPADHPTKSMWYLVLVCPQPLDPRNFVLVCPFPLDPRYFVFVCPPIISKVLRVRLSPPHEIKGISCSSVPPLDPRYCHTQLPLGFQLGWRSGKFQLARWSHKVKLFSERIPSTHHLCLEGLDFSICLFYLHSSFNQYPTQLKSRVWTSQLSLFVLFSVDLKNLTNLTKLT